MASYLTDPPDPGSVESDDRCPSCSARDGELCDVECRCGACIDAAAVEAGPFETSEDFDQQVAAILARVK